MLDLFSQVIVSILSGYLAFTGFLAAEIEALLPPADPVTVESAESHRDTTESITSLPSQYEFGGMIPSILRQNAAYQQAAALGSQGTSTQSEPTKSPEEQVTDALVNIFCTYTTETYERTTTGTGVLIDDSGVILTNAHVAQFYLLEATRDNGETSCTIRTGNPATARYEAELLYISPMWITENAEQINAERPQGTGERDYALLYIAESINGFAPQTDFPALTIDPDLLPRSTEGSRVLAGGYPAGILSTEGPSAKLVPRVAETNISELYTFESSYADIFSIKGTDVGEHGSSGGPIVNDNGDVIGLIVTKGNDEIDGEGSLRALTLSYVDRTIEEETGFTLTENIDGNITEKAAVFNEVLTPFLLDTLETELHN